MRPLRSAITGRGAQGPADSATHAFGFSFYLGHMGHDIGVFQPGMRVVRPAPFHQGGFVMRLAAYQPDIPQNLGALMRLSVCFGMPLDVIEPCGFPFSTRAVRKAAMDYGAEADITAHDGWSAYLAGRAAQPACGRLILLTTKAATAHWACDFRPDDTLLLDRKSVV